MFRPSVNRLTLCSWILLLSICSSRRLDAQESSEEPAPFARDFATPEEIDFSRRIIQFQNERRMQEASARPGGGLQTLRTFEFELEGESEEAIVREAIVRALKNTAARLYFDNYILLGRDLLEPYLNIYGDRFVARRSITQRQILADGTYRLRVRIGVDVDRFYSDLQEKRFVAEPRLRPIVVVMLAETIDGRPVQDGTGRTRLEDALRRNELRVESQLLAAQGLARDISNNPQALTEVRDEAQRWEIGIIITGSLDVTSSEEREILFDRVSFVEGAMHLKMIRVDTGEVLRESTEKYSASGPTQQEALDNLLGSLTLRSGEKLAQGFLDHWSTLMLNRADYRLLITGVNAELLTSISSTLKTLSPSLELFVKSLYGDVAVVNVVFPDSEPGELEEFLRRSRAPQFRVVPSDGRRFELDVL